MLNDQQRLQDCMNANKASIFKPQLQLPLWMRRIEYRKRLFRLCVVFPMVNLPTSKVDLPSCLMHVNIGQYAYNSYVQVVSIKSAFHSM